MADLLNEYFWYILATWLLLNAVVFAFMYRRGRRWTKRSPAFRRHVEGQDERKT